MLEQDDSASTYSQVYKSMSEKETEDLIKIWKENDRDAWRDEAFDAVKTILLERNIELPEQGADNHQNDDIDNIQDTAVEYPKDKKLFWIADLAGTLSWVVLGISILYALMRIIAYFFIQIQPSNWEKFGVFNGIVVVMGQLDGVLYSGFAFLVLQAISEIIYLLLDIRDMVQPEEN